MIRTDHPINVNQDLKEKGSAVKLGCRPFSCWVESNFGPASSKEGSGRYRGRLFRIFAVGRLFIRVPDLESMRSMIAGAPFLSRPVSAYSKITRRIGRYCSSRSRNNCEFSNDSKSLNVRDASLQTGKVSRWVRQHHPGLPAPEVRSARLVRSNRVRAAYCLRLNDQRRQIGSFPADWTDDSGNEIQFETGNTHSVQQPPSIKCLQNPGRLKILMRPILIPAGGSTNWGHHGRWTLLRTLHDASQGNSGIMRRVLTTARIGCRCVGVRGRFDPATGKEKSRKVPQNLFFYSPKLESAHQHR